MVPSASPWNWQGWLQPQKSGQKEQTKLTPHLHLLCDEWTSWGQGEPEDQQGKRPFNTLSLPILLLGLSGLWSNRMLAVQCKTNKQILEKFSHSLPSLFPQTWTQITQSILAAEETLSSPWWRIPLSSSTVRCLPWPFSWTRKSRGYSNHDYLGDVGSEICLPRPSEVSGNILELVVCDWTCRFK